MGGQLVSLSLLIDPVPAQRVVLLAPELQGLIYGPWGCTDAEVRCLKLREDLEAFVRGDPVTVSLRPFKAKSANFALLDKVVDEIWDVRSRDPSPGLRVLGAFADIDVFVALTCWPRSRAVPWLPRPMLGSKDSAEYSEAIVDAKQKWQALFGDTPRIGNGGSDVQGYISKGAVVV